MILGGSELLNTATDNSDLDIIFLLPEIYGEERKSQFCNKCFNKNYFETRPCSEHDLIFGENQLSLYSNMKKEIVSEETINELELNENEANINLINARLPLLAFEIKGVEIDVMIANIPDLKIEKDLDLTNHDNIENIKRNLKFIEEKISTMIKTENKLYKESILILTGYRIAYRTKFYLIESSRWQLFSDLLRIVKYWAKTFEQFEKTNLPLKENFYKEIFKELKYEKEYEHFLMIVCTEEIKDGGKECESLKTKVRVALINWAKNALLKMEIEGNDTVHIKNYLLEYHALTDFESKCTDKELNSLLKEGNTINCPKIEIIECKDETNKKWKKIQVEQRKWYLTSNVRKNQIHEKSKEENNNDLLPRLSDIKFEKLELSKDLFVKIPINAKFYQKKEFKEYRKRPLIEEHNEKRNIHKVKKKDEEKMEKN
uniref:Polymerase nucleotidyl transferase domain-containing protein n=1 Tax=Meloidogyne hapla TaxID=6305 RepID=A0A1I8B020_MELHA